MNSRSRNQEMHASPIEPARCPHIITYLMFIFYLFLYFKGVFSGLTRVCLSPASWHPLTSDTSLFEHILLFQLHSKQSQPVSALWFCSSCTPCKEGTAHALTQPALRRPRTHGWIGPFSCSLVHHDFTQRQGSSHTCTNTHVHMYKTMKTLIFILTQTSAWSGKYHLFQQSLGSIKYLLRGFDIRKSVKYYS